MHWSGRYLAIELTGLNQKRAPRLFLKLGDIYAYLLGISSKIGGKWGHLVFFGSEVGAIFWKFPV